MKNSFLLTVSFLLIATFVSCSNAVAYNNVNNKPIVNYQQNKMEFSEVKRFNKDVVLPEVTLITTFKKTVEIYDKLSNKNFSRSEPIPTFEENEYLLVLKPKLSKILYGDIEVTEIESKNQDLIIKYREVKSEEYQSDKLKHPVLIIKLTGKAPESIKLLAIN
ncbi:MULTISPECIES: hypothetical protein [Chryseobacterium]|uniref:Lipoprotein n=1 Tax=Chryseobacterium taihuense TaxID=1141221 RepID=A0A4U8WJQ2_9FLAO|nr:MULTISPECIES: hypothetical protein [Chryseobacterium]QQV01437.1 hypothetical protein I6I61_10015 [Chryseobacterium sp. FDAARGOS 1104]VFB05375.1 Uncharacterised protein [Chryseobacterium taihuense]